MQVMYATVRGEIRSLEMPPPSRPVTEGLSWGRFDEIGTPAYWRSQAWLHDQLGTYDELRLGSTLAEEVAACLLGGFGIPAELGLAAYWRLRSEGLLQGTPTREELEEQLSRPFTLADKARRYRFPRQKAGYLAECLRRLPDIQESGPDRDLRDALARLPGVGLKTASWVVRNVRRSHDVAVLDVHLMRAFQQMRAFPVEMNPQRDYLRLEAKFLRISYAMGVPAYLLDALIWDQMRQMPDSRRAGRTLAACRAERRSGGHEPDARQLTLAA